MAEVELDTNLRAWGNSYGIVIPVAVARKLNLQAGGKVHVRISHELPRNNADDLPKWRFPHEVDIDAILDEDLGADGEL